VAFIERRLLALLPALGRLASFPARDRLKPAGVELATGGGAARELDRLALILVSLSV
jgi:hypothetical protein